jgi:hypothetical protein
VKEDFEPEDILDLWFESGAWKQITEDSVNGCKDSTTLMERINDQLGSLIFHLSNNSNPEKIAYELDYFVQLCTDFDIFNEQQYE